MEEKGEYMEKLDYRLYENGRWDITGGAVALCHAYPAIDGSLISPVRVTKGEDFIRYQLEQGELQLQFLKKDGEIEVRCWLLGLSGIHDVEPMADGEVKGAGRAFLQGFGMEGPSGTRNIGEEPLTSNGLVGLYCPGHAFFVYALEHGKYVNRYYLSRRRGPFTEGSVCLQGGFNLEGTAGEEEMLPSLFFKEAPSLDAGLSACAKRIAAAMGARHRQPPAFHWCSWYYLYQNLSQELLEEYVDGFQKEKIPFRYIQIDAGYAPSLGDWLLPSHLFPEGLKEAARIILKAGFQPGIWIGPFMVGDRSRLFAEHPDWILRDLDGKPVTMIQSYNEPKVWGNRDSDYYVLDTSHPEAMAYLKEVFETLHAWGFSLFKTDFMLWNMHDTAKVKRYDGSRTSVEIFRDTLRMIREAIGEESYFLGCIAPFLPFIGFADGMRIAGDVGAQWAEDYGPVNMIREVAADNYFNHVYWQNDPDSVLLREFEIFLKPHEIQSLALLQALSGGMVTTSDPVHQIGEERRKLLRFLTPGEKVRPRFPLLEEERTELVLLHELEQGKLLYAMNPSGRPLTVAYEFGEFFEEPEWYVRRFGEALSEKKSWYTTVLKPHESLLLFLTREPLAEEPRNLWRW